MTQASPPQLSPRHILSSSRLQNIVAMLLLGLLVFAAYGQSLHYDFVWDDNGLIVHNRIVKSPDAFRTALASSFWDLGHDQDISRKFYRPVITLSYITDYRIWGLNPAGFHLTNLLAHLACSIFVFLAARELLNHAPAAFLAAAVFAIHPSHVENVVWISGRTDVFSCLGLVAALWLYLKRAGANHHFSVSLCGIVTLFAFSLLAKEIGIVLIPLLIGHYIIMEKDRIPFKRFIVMQSCMVLIAIVYFMIRNAALGSLALQLEQGSLSAKLLTAPFVMSRYLGALLVLIPTDPHHNDLLIRAPGLEWWLVPIPACLLYAAVFFLAWSKKQHVMTYGLLWIPIALAPMFNFGTFGDVIWADRFLYVASIGYGLTLAALMTRIWHWQPSTGRRMVLVASSLILLASLTGSRATSTRWKDDISLFSHAVKTSPRSVLMHVNLADSYMDSGQPEKAVIHFGKAIAILPAHVEANIEMAGALKEQGSLIEALSYLTTAEELTRFDPGQAVTPIKRTKEENEILNTSIVHHKGMKDRRLKSIYAHRGDIYRQQGGLQQAERAYRMSLEYGSTYEVHNNLAALYILANNLTEAEKQIEQAAAMSNTPEVALNRAEIHNLQKNHQRALNELNALQADALPPASIVMLHYQRAVALKGLNSHEKARIEAQKALRMIPSVPSRRALRPLLEELQAPIP